MSAIGQPKRGTRPADFFDCYNVVEIAEPKPAIIFIDSDPMQAKLAHLLPQFIAGEIVLAVNPVGNRHNLLIGKAAYAFPDHLRTFT